eukprot:GILI01040531.1.p1 GENE.GILI01040531.1~~GILI01040531.1.p1  ORF type:complete len:250 (-),score=98.17 GILI01040531.1:118-867(-)
MRKKGSALVKEKLITFQSDMKKADADEQALAADRARREEELRRMEEASKSTGELKQQLLQQAKEREAQMKREEEEKARLAAQALSEAEVAAKKAKEKEAGTGSVWNVNSYFWEEKPLSDWAKQRLRELLSAVAVDIPAGKLEVVEVTSLEGDASVSIRKGKKILSYQFECRAKWRGQLRDGDGQVLVDTDGALHLPDLGVDVEPEELEVRVDVNGASAGHDRLKDAMRRQGADAIRSAINVFVTEMKAK